MRPARSDSWRRPTFPLSSTLHEGGGIGGSDGELADVSPLGEDWLMPSSKWPLTGEEARANRRQPFGGYAPVTHAYDPGQLVSHRMTARKLVAAAPFDHQRQQWERFELCPPESREQFENSSAQTRGKTDYD